MASNQTGGAPVKLSFAKVAASTYSPRRTTPQAVSSDNASRKDTRPDEAETSRGKTSEPVTVGEVKAGASEEPSKSMTKNAKVLEGNIRTGRFSNKLMPIPILRGGPDIKPVAAGAENINSSVVHDDSTQVSASDGSVKQPAADNKSVMDEKESLRPDDSASIRAVEDDEGLSTSGAGAAGSRVGSDVEARAFRDQLREISVMTPRSVIVDRPQASLCAAAGLTFGDMPAATTLAPQLITEVMPSEAIPLRPGVVPIPDEKLMEALASHRDRLFVLKLEQDIIDFVKDSQEMQLALPQTNSFYRMLAHKLADYYLLNHTVDQNETGAAVVILKGSVCRFPPPLSAIPNSALSNNPLPSEIPTRMIMRRNGKTPNASGTNTSVNSEGPSKTTSEAGDNSGGSDVGASSSTGKKSKKTLTREEREAKYKEARERIFGVVQDGEAKDREKSNDEREMSRSSSAAGKKKQSKKQRTPINDDFEPRSQFASTYFAQSQIPDGYVNSEVSYYPGYPDLSGGNQFGFVHQSQMQSMYPGCYPPVLSVDGQFPYSSYQPYEFSPQDPNGFDLSAQFQQGMQSFQTAGNSPLASHLGSPIPKGFATSVQPTAAMNPQYAPMAYPPGYALSPQSSYPQPGFVRPPMASPSSISPAAYAPYGNLSMFLAAQPDTQDNGVFNPQSQAFVPTGRAGPSQSSSHVRSPHFTPVTHHGQPQAVPRSYMIPPANAYQSSARSSQSNNAIQPQPPLVNGTSPGLPANPTLSQPPQQGSSIAKWGTPAHLPPKPPPPASMEPAKYNELNRGLQGFPGLPRIPTTATSTGKVNQA